MAGDSFTIGLRRGGGRLERAVTIEQIIAKRMRNFLHPWRVGSAALLLVTAASVYPTVSPASHDSVAFAADGFSPLFNGSNLDDWYTWIASTGKNNDPEGYFKVEADGSLHVLGIPPTNQTKSFGYISTNAEYHDYHLRFQYRWGTNKFAPRAADLRDSGLLYHVTGSDTIWPTSVESQVQEGDTGDFFLLAGPGVETEVAPGTVMYQPGGSRMSTNSVITTSSVQDSLTEWNTVEVIARGNSSVHIVNGVVVNRAFNITLAGRPLTTGRIAFQAEGAEISYRNVEIKPLAATPEPPRILTFSKTAGFRHDSIPAALASITQLGIANAFTVDQTEDENQFTDANLARYDAVVFVSTTGDVLNAAHQAAFEQFIRSGGGYAGIHSASDTEYEWPWYGQLVGAYFKSHPTPQIATMRVENRVHPSTSHLGPHWARADEWYDFGSNPRANVNVLLSLYEGTYTGATMVDHPIAWYHRYDGGRSWYTGGGHSASAYSEPDFARHILGGIEYAAGIEAAPAPPGSALDRTSWTATASSVAPGSTPDQAFDGDLLTRFSTGAAQTAGMVFQLDLGVRQEVNRVELDVVKELFDFPRSYALYVSNEPPTFDQPVATGTGTSPRTTIEFDPVTARYLRIVQTGSAPDRWWSIYDMNVYAPPELKATFIIRATALAPARRLGPADGA